MEIASPEMRFLLKCVDRTAQPDAAQDVVRNIDWDVFLGLTRAHRCVPQVYKRLSELTADRKASGFVPDTMMESLKNLTTKIAVCNVRMTETLCDIQDLLRKNEIRVACIKGPALSMLAYGNTTMRQFGDLDLIVSGKDMDRAVELILQHGYEFRELSSKANISSYLNTLQAVTFQNSDRTIYVDVSSVLISHLLSPPELADLILDSSSILPVDEKSGIYSPGPELMMMAVCVHGAEDMWNKLMAVADVAALLDSHPDADWAGMLTTAAKWGQRRSALIGMAVAQKLLNADLPEGIAKAVSSDPGVMKLAEDAVNGLVSRGSLNAGLLKQKLFEIRSRDRAGDKLRWFIRMVFVPTAGEYNAVTLPQSQSFLYYLLRPFRLALRIITGLPHGKTIDVK